MINWYVCFGFKIKFCPWLSHEILKIFDDTYVKSSTPSLFGLTCESSYLRNIYGSAYMIGLLCGSIILGILSDKCGRKTALITGVVILSCSGKIFFKFWPVYYWMWIIFTSGFICAFVPQGPVYAFFRFLSGNKLKQHLCPSLLSAW